jgi:hypothetical protein
MCRIRLLEFIIIKSNYFHNAQKGECFKIIQKLFALVRERIVVRQHANIDFAHYYAVAKCHFEGSEQKLTFCKMTFRKRNS